MIRSWIQTLIGWMDRQSTALTTRPPKLFGNSKAADCWCPSTKVSTEEHVICYRCWASVNLAHALLQVKQRNFPAFSLLVKFFFFTFTGDSRATEQPQLAVMHTLWAREHNRVAGILASLNPTWTDETLFQEARRIVVGELQHITFNEFIPTLLSMKAWLLRLCCRHCTQSLTCCGD